MKSFLKQAVMAVFLLLSAVQVAHAQEQRRFWGRGVFDDGIAYLRMAAGIMNM